LAVVKGGSANVSFILLGKKKRKLANAVFFRKNAQSLLHSIKLFPIYSHRMKKGGFLV